MWGRIHIYSWRLFKDANVSIAAKVEGQFSVNRHLITLNPFKMKRPAAVLKKVFRIYVIFWIFLCSAFQLENWVGKSAWTKKGQILKSHHLSHLWGLALATIRGRQPEDGSGFLSSYYCEKQTLSYTDAQLLSKISKSFSREKKKWQRKKIHLLLLYKVLLWPNPRKSSA